MKNIIYSLFLLTTITSCSDKLTNSKAENIIEECLNDNPKYGEIVFKTGELRFYEKKEDDAKSLLAYKKLSTEGYINMDSISFSSRYNYSIYKVSFTDKSKDFVLENETDAFYGVLKSTVRTFDYKIDEVKEVHEIPSLHAAEVTVVYLKKNKTPFFEFENDNTDFITKKLGFRKTSDNGWKHCD
ncbi:hypothetical protein [Cellulophaga sp. L1A9]|uniref:hypothetical protein n=1 Tax=Cellulophaga sp. L1A9 TaxID=2686362 RepID=UPI00131C257A|nr:hypothetical protein [Cellulophaga sp. L1A9]